MVDAEEAPAEANAIGDASKSKKSPVGPFICLKGQMSTCAVREGPLGPPEASSCSVFDSQSVRLKSNLSGPRKHT